MNRETLRAQRQAVVSGIAGNVMEWYDFSVYGYFAAIIGRQFFPAGDPVSSLLAAFGVFAAGFLMRPLGSLLFGHVGDKSGRKLALTASVALMAVPTFLIGALPSYQQIGVWAPLLLVLMRLLQGLSVGGEYTTSSIFLVEGSAVRGPPCTLGLEGKKCCGSPITVRGNPSRSRRLAIYRGCFRKRRPISGPPEVVIDPLLKLNGNCSGDRGPSVAPQAEQYRQQVAEQLLGLPPPGPHRKQANTPKRSVAVQPR